ncbi:MAG TPA: MBL fold metallo-hydrolase [Mycobacteriales bacterium]|nr:MBL fold metallo-hydrolase [Mycobacteriales bacterium]
MIRWDLITVGHLSRNRYWGESEDRPHRETCCTCTLIRTGERTILVDPSLPPEQMEAAVDRRTGQRIASVDAVFVTHRHGDHWLGIEAFPDAQWLMAPAELAGWRSEAGGEQGRIAARFSAAMDIAPGVQMLSTPGHTEGLTSLAFHSGGRRVVVTGDGVMTADFFAKRDVYFNSVDAEEAVRSIDRIAEHADIVVPGHDNYFLV